jgi:hypothetical protein
VPGDAFARLRGGADHRRFGLIHAGRYRFDSSLNGAT